MKQRRIYHITPDVVQKAKSLLGKKSQHEIARELKISQTTVHHIEKGVYDNPYQKLPVKQLEGNNIFNWNNFQNGVL